MDNDVSISQNKDGANDSLKQEDKETKESADGDGLCGDQSLIEVKSEIPVVDLLDAEEKIMVNTDPVWLKKYDTCEEVTTNGEGENTLVKKESSDEDKTNKTAEGSKGGEIKTEPDTLILEIDNTDNLDVYLERTKKKAENLKKENTVKHNLAAENSEKIENGKPVDSIPAKADALEENTSSPEKCGDSALPNPNTSKKKTPKKEIVKKRSIGKPTPARSLSDEAEKIAQALQQKKDGDSKEPPRKKIECKTEPTNDEKCKNQVEVEKKPNIEDVKILNDSTIKTEDKKLESRFIWISNISKNTKATDLKLHLTSHGKVMTAKIVTDGKLYYGYVVMEKRDDVSNCIKNLDDTVFEGKKIRLSDRVPEKKPNKNQGGEQIPVKTEPISPEQIKAKNSPEMKSNKEKDVRKRTRRSRSHDPLTLKVKAPQRKFDRFSEERRRRKNEEELRRNRDRASEEQRRRREIEREREERRKQKIKEEEHRQTELKLERERKKLERERELIERERLDLIRLQKKLADTERCMLSRQKVEIERNIRNISEDYKKRKSPGGFEDNRKNKFGRVEMVEHRRPPENRDYWKSERRTSPIKGKKECFEIESYPTKKSGREDNVGVAPPPPILTDSFDLSDRRRKEKEREWESRVYDKKEFSERPVFKDRKAVEDYNFGDRRDCVPEKHYNRERYKPKYEKPPTGNWEKNSSAPYKSVPSSASWRSDVVRVIQRHPPSGFPVPPQFGSTTGMAAHYYPQPEYARQTEFYGRPPDRKY